MGFAFCIYLKWSGYLLSTRIGWKGCSLEILVVVNCEVCEWWTLVKWSFEYVSLMPLFKKFSTIRKNGVKVWVEANGNYMVLTNFQLTKKFMRALYNCSMFVPDLSDIGLGFKGKFESFWVWRKLIKVAPFSCRKPNLAVPTLPGISKGGVWSILS